MSKNLGEKIDVNKMAEEDVWASVEQAESAFSVPDLAKESKKEKKTAKQVQKEEVKQEPVSMKKASVQLNRFRELFSVKRIDVKYYDLVTRSIDEKTNESIRVGLRAMNYEDYQWCLEQAINLQQNTQQYIFTKQDAIANGFAWKQAIVAISVCSLDNEPIWSVFGIEDKDNKDPNYPKLSPRIEAAALLLNELKTTLYDTVDELHDAIFSLVKTYNAKLVEETENPLPLKS